MKIGTLKALEYATWRLSYYTASLVELELTPDLTIPVGFDNREEYGLHLGNMIGIYRDELIKAYNDVPEWVSK